MASSSLALSSPPTLPSGTIVPFILQPGTAQTVTTHTDGSEGFDTPSRLTITVCPSGSLWYLSVPTGEESYKQSNQQSNLLASNNLHHRHQFTAPTSLEGFKKELERLGIDLDTLPPLITASKEQKQEFIKVVGTSVPIEVDPLLECLFADDKIDGATAPETSSRTPSFAVAVGSKVLELHSRYGLFAFLVMSGGLWILYYPRLQKRQEVIEYAEYVRAMILETEQENAARKKDQEDYEAKIRKYREKLESLGDGHEGPSSDEADSTDDNA